MQNLRRGHYELGVDSHALATTAAAMGDLYGTALANDELTGPYGEGYRRMIEASPAGRAGLPALIG